MTEYTKNKLTIAILDFKREKESGILLDSLTVNLKVPSDILYCHDGPPEKYVIDSYAQGRIDKLILTKEPLGCGIQTRQLFHSCMTEYILYCQVDQYLMRPFTEEHLNQCVEILNRPGVFYVDLAGNQGHGRPSERALIMKNKAYLDIPGIDDTIGGPGRYADHRWTEQHLQEYMASNNLTFASINPLFFVDNGKWSNRSYKCGGETCHSTDEKVLFIIKPLKQRYDFPNLKLSDSEWEEVLNGKWPAEGKIPEADKPHSFKAW